MDHEHAVGAFEHEDWGGTDDESVGALVLAVSVVAAPSLLHKGREGAGLKASRAPLEQDDGDHRPIPAAVGRTVLRRVRLQGIGPFPGPALQAFEVALGEPGEQWQEAGLRLGELEEEPNGAGECGQGEDRRSREGGGADFLPGADSDRR